MGKYTQIPGKVKDGVDTKRLKVDDSDFERDWPALFEYLSLDDDEGVARQTSTLLVFVQDGRFTLCLNDREQGRSAFTASGTLREAMTQLDEALALGTAEWRYRDRNGRGNSRKSA